MIRIVIADDQAMVRAGFAALLNAHSDIEVVGQASDGAECVQLVAELKPEIVLMDVRMPVQDGIEATREILAAHPQASTTRTSNSPSDSSSTASFKQSTQPTQPNQSTQSKQSKQSKQPTSSSTSTSRRTSLLPRLTKPAIPASRPSAAKAPMAANDALAGEMNAHTEINTAVPRIIMLTTFDIDDYVFDAIRAGASGFLLKDAVPDELAEAVRIVASGDGLLAPSVTRRVIEHFAAGPRSSNAQALPELTDREREILVLVARGETNTEVAESLCIAVQTVKTHVSRILYKLDARDRAQAVIAAYESGLVVPKAQV